MKILILLITTLSLLACGQKKKDAQYYQMIAEYRASLTEREGASFTEEKPSQSEPIAHPLLEKIKNGAHRVSEKEFANEMSASDLTDSLESFFADYKKFAFNQRFDSASIAHYADMTDQDVAYLFARDTFWINEVSEAMYQIGLANDTYGMIQTNKYRRTVTERLVEKYYRLLLSAITEEDKPKLIAAHNKWGKSIDADYTLASNLSSKGDGSLQAYTWSREVDELLFRRAIFYYEMYQYKVDLI